MQYKYLGNTLLGDGGNKLLSLSALEKIPVVGLYFTAEWCPPCKIFTPHLLKFYKEVNKDEKKFEVVLVSCDLDLQEFEIHFKQHPWLSLPFDQKLCSEIAERYDVSQVPTLVILRRNGKMLKKEGRYDVRFKPEDCLDSWILCEVDEENDK